MKLKLLIAAFCISLGLIGYLTSKLYLERKIKKITVAQPSQIISEAETEVKILSEKVDKKGFTVTTAERKQAIISNGDLSKLPISQSVFDSLRLDNIDKSKKLQQATLINAKLSAVALRATKKVDSLHKVYYIYHDDFMNISFKPDSVSGTFDYSGDIKLITHEYKLRKSIFHKYRYYTDVLTPNPNIKISGMQMLTIKDRPQSRFGVALVAGYSYSPEFDRFSPTFGVGLTYDLFKLNLFNKN